MNNQSTNTIVAPPPGGGFRPGPGLPSPGLPSPGLPSPGPGFGGRLPGVGDLLDILGRKGARGLSGVLQDAGVGRGLSQLISLVALRQGRGALEGIGGDAGITGGGGGKPGLPLNRAVTLVQNGDLPGDARVTWQIEYSGRARGEGGGRARDQQVGGAVRRACPSLRTGEGDSALGSGVVHHEFETDAACIPALARELGRVSSLWDHCRIIRAPDVELPSGPGRTDPTDPPPTDPPPTDPPPTDPPPGGGGPGPGDGGNGSFLGDLGTTEVVLIAALLFFATRA